MNRPQPSILAPLRTRLRRLHRDQRGATSLEWTLLLAVIAIPSYFVIEMLLDTLVAHYQMITTINALPLP